MSEKDIAQIVATSSLSNKIDAQSTVDNIYSVYVGGDLMTIEVKDLVGNEVAIKQLINNHNDQAKKRDEVERRLVSKEAEIEYLKTSPFIAALATIVGVIGTIVGGIGINLVSANPPPPHGTPLLVLGFVLVVASGLATCLYPYARRWFNKTAD